MPRYLTIEELLERRRNEQLLHLANDGAGGLDTDRLVQAIGDAEGEVTSWLSSRYGDRLPTAPADASDELKRLVADLVPYHLSKGAAVMPEQIVEEHRAVVSQLRAVAQGVAVLDLPSKPAVDSSRPVITSLRPASDANLTLAKLEDW